MIASDKLKNIDKEVEVKLIEHALNEAKIPMEFTHPNLVKTYYFA